MAKATANYLGKVPAKANRLPRGLPRTVGDTMKRTGARPKASRAATPRVNPAAASAGVGRPPAGGGSGIPKATTPMASAPSKTINKPKTGAPRNSRSVAKPRADISSKI